MNQLHGDFWNFRGDFRIAGIVNVGTHMSLIRKPDGRYLAIDSYCLDDDDRGALLAMTDSGRAVDAIINVHPFHTLHCAALHALLPGARLFGTRRHHRQLSELPWDPAPIEDAATQAAFADTLAFTVPLGVDFVSQDNRVHVASVIVRHRASAIVHVDDTINVLAPPQLLKTLLPEPSLRFHPMLAKALEKRVGAADAYARWARDLASRWSDTAIVCAAHSAVRHLPTNGWRTELSGALDRVGPTLDRHRRAHG